MLYKIVNCDYQGFGGFQFNIAGTYEQKEDPVLGSSGFHCCCGPLACYENISHLELVPNGKSLDFPLQYLSVVMAGDGDFKDGKIATNRIRIADRIMRHEWLQLMDKEITEVVTKNDLTRTNALLMAGAIENYMPALEAVVKFGKPVEFNVWFAAFGAAAGWGSLDALKFIWKTWGDRCALTLDSALARAAANGRIEAMKWLEECTWKLTGRKFCEAVCKIAARHAVRYGRNKMVVWMLESGWNLPIKEVFRVALLEENIELLRWTGGKGGADLSLLYLAEGYELKKSAEVIRKWLLEKS